MSFTYDELKQSIQDYTENDETTFVNNLPLFIRLAEERILAPFSLSIEVSGAKEFLLFKDLDFVQTYTPDATTTGQPKYYAQFDVGNFIVGPTPDAAYVVELQYLYRPASLTAGAGSGTSWLSENAEITLLYASLIEAYTYMKGDPNLMQMYNQRYAEGITRLKNLGEAQEVVDEYRYGQIRKPRT